MAALIDATDAHFAWMLGEVPAFCALTLPPDGVHPPRELRWLRGNLKTTPPGSTWLIVAEGEVVGVCSLKGDPDADGFVEIGYGVAGERRRRGHASTAVAQLVAIVRDRPNVAGLIAETAVGNVASQRVLQANGFAQLGMRTDSEDGALYQPPLGFTGDGPVS